MTLASENEGVGLFWEQELSAYLSLGGEIEYETPVTSLITNGEKVIGILNQKMNIFHRPKLFSNWSFQTNKKNRRLSIWEKIGNLPKLELQTILVTV